MLRRSLWYGLCTVPHPPTKRCTWISRTDNVVCFFRLQGEYEGRRHEDRRDWKTLGRHQQATRGYKLIRIGINSHSIPDGDSLTYDDSRHEITWMKNFTHLKTSLVKKAFEARNSSTWRPLTSEIIWRKNFTHRMTFCQETIWRRRLKHPVVITAVISGCDSSTALAGMKSSAMCKYHRLGDYRYSPIEGAGNDALHSSAISLAGGS